METRKTLCYRIACASISKQDIFSVLFLQIEGNDKRSFSEGSRTSTCMLDSNGANFKYLNEKGNELKIVDN